MKLIQGDCLEKLKDLSDNSVDIVISDLPFGRFSHLKWDSPIDLEKMWIQLNRVCKITTPICLFADFKFAVELINSNKKYFKWELVWNKGATTTPLLSRRRFGKATEYVLFFYRKQCCYNYAQYHKVKKTKTEVIHRVLGAAKVGGKINYYEPKLPTNVVSSSLIIGSNKKMTQPSFFFTENKKGSSNNHLKRTNILYDPLLPTNVISTHLNHRGNHNVDWKKYNTYSPKLPINVINKNTMDGVVVWGGKKGLKYLGGRQGPAYEPKLPINIIKHPSVRLKKIIKHITEKPQFLLEHILKYFSNPGDVCLDFVMGSGSCGVACHTLGRNFIGIEKNEDHFKAAKKRLEDIAIFTENEQ